MKTILYYFSATGNSLKVAKEIKNALCDAKLVPILKTLRSGYEFEKAERIGFVFPLHYQDLPVPVLEFFKKGVFGGAEYIFCIITRGTPPTGGALSHLKKLLKNKSLSLSSGFYLNMPATDITSFFNVPPEEKQKIILQRSQKRLKEIAQIILRNEQYLDAEPLKFIRFIRYPYFLKRIKSTYKYFWTDNNCTRCGLCERVCPMGAVESVNGKPVWNGQCVECEACINICPNRAIQYRKITLTKRRYHHPDISIDELIVQKAYKV